MGVANLIESRIPKKILSVSSSYERYSGDLKFDPPSAFLWIFWHGRIVSDQVHNISYIDIFSSSK